LAGLNAFSFAAVSDGISEVWIRTWHKPLDEKDFPSPRVILLETYLVSVGDKYCENWEEPEPDKLEENGKITSGIIRGKAIGRSKDAYIRSHCGQPDKSKRRIGKLAFSGK